MASGDDVQLPDLQVIQRYSLAVRGASAPRTDVIAALEADLAWLRAGRDKPAARPVAKAAEKPVAKAADKPAAKAAAKAPAKKAPAKKSARKA